MARKPYDRRFNPETELPPGFKEYVARDGRVTYQHRYRLAKADGTTGWKTDTYASFEECLPAFERYRYATRTGTVGEYVDAKQIDRLSVDQGLTLYADARLDRDTAAAAGKPSNKTIDEYERVIENVLLPRIGQMPLKKLNRRVVRSLRDALVKEGFSYYQIELVLKVLSAACTWLIENIDGEVFNGNVHPVRGIKIGIPRPPKNERRKPLTPLQIEKIAWAMGEIKKKVPRPKKPALEVPRSALEVLRDRLVVYFYCYLGLRPIEMRHLRWRDAFNREEQVFRSRLQFNVSKTEASRDRQVRMFSPVRDVLAAYWKAVEEPDQDTLIFTGNRGGSFNGKNWGRRQWLQALELAGIDRRVTYAGRHSALTNLELAGWEARSISDFAGHTLTSYSQDLYGDAPERAFEDDDIAARRGVPIEEQIRAAREDVFGANFTWGLSGDE